MLPQQGSFDGTVRIRDCQMSWRPPADKETLEREMQMISHLVVMGFRGGSRLSP
jgi:hypothetical protein